MSSARRLWLLPRHDANTAASKPEAGGKSPGRPTLPNGRPGPQECLTTLQPELGLLLLHHPPLAGGERQLQRHVRVDELLLRLRIRVAALLRLRVLVDVLLLTVAATASVPALRVAGSLVDSCVLVGLALVACISVGLVDRLLLGRRARARVLLLGVPAGVLAQQIVDRVIPVRVVTLAVVGADPDRNVGVHGVLLGLRVRVRLLLRPGVLRDVLLLPVPAATRPALAV